MSVGGEEQAHGLEPKVTRAFVVMNSKSGSSKPIEARRALDRHFGAEGISFEVYEPSRDEPLNERIRAAIASGCGLVVAAGGDGTVSSVADALVGTTTPLGIIPMGTANVLAGELGIPFNLDGACRLLAGRHALAAIDAMELEGRIYVTQIGVGLDAAMIRDTPDAEKRRFGRLAYMRTAAFHLAGLPALQFTLQVDGATTHPRALQVLAANSGTLGRRPFRWGPNIKPDDGVLNVCVIRARSLLDFLSIGWHFLIGRHRRHPNVRYLSATREITIATKHPLPVQADGEIVGQTPITIRLLAKAFKVVVPLSAHHAASP